MDKEHALGAPSITPTQRVAESWIDYNGHMNISYYTQAFDTAIDGFLQEVLGIGPDFVAEAGQGPYVLQAHYHYLDELLAGEPFFVRIYLPDADSKRLHLMAEMVHADTGEPVATLETIMINVDLQTRRSTPYPDWACARIEALRHANAGIQLPAQFGRPMGLRRA